MNDVRQAWMPRAIKATNGPNTRTGAVVWAMTGCNDNRAKRGLPSIYPTFGPSCIIDVEGFIRSNFAKGPEDVYIGALVGDTSDVRDNLNRLADHIEASDDEREDMFAAFRSWIASDFRAMADRDEITALH